MAQLTESELRYVDVYKDLCNLARIFEIRPPETESVRKVFLKRAEKLAFSYDSIFPPEWKKRLHFDTAGLIKRIRGLEYSIAL